MLNDKNTGIPISKLGSIEFIEALVRKTSLREGFGSVLAQGIFEAANIIGGEAKEQIQASLNKTGHFYVYPPRLYIVTGILHATEPRTPIQQLHEVSFIVHGWLDWYNKVEGSFVATDVLRAISRRFFGGENAFDFSTYEGKALAAKMIQDREYAKECLILCDFSWPMRYIKHSEDHVGDPTVESSILTAITGKEIDEQGLYQIGERVFNLQRAILIREGHKGRENDALAKADFTVPLKSDPGNPEALVTGKGGQVISRKGAVIDEQKFEDMKSEYYQLRGWDIRTGLQRRDKLLELDLSDIAEQLEAKKGLV
jgi:aldehyde:ferredoxin oxidoreductase